MRTAHDFIWDPIFFSGCTCLCKFSTWNTIIIYYYMYLHTSLNYVLLFMTNCLEHECIIIFLLFSVFCLSFSFSIMLLQFHSWQKVLKSSMYWGSPHFSANFICHNLGSFYTLSLGIPKNLGNFFCLLIG